MGWEWLSQLLHTFTDLIPRPLIVRTDERCVAFIFGRWPRVLAPGWYLAWPLISKYEIVAVRRQVTSRKQRFGKSAFRWKVVYEIHDPLSLVTNTYDFDETIADFGEIAFAAVYRRTESADDMLTVKSRGRVISKIRSELAPFGVSVIDFSVVSQSTADLQVSVWELQSHIPGATE